MGLLDRLLRGSSNNDIEPEINTSIYSHFIETAVKSYRYVYEGAGYAYIRVRPCDTEGKLNGNRDCIQYCCEFSEMQPSISHYIKENVWSGCGAGYKFIDNSNEYGMPIDGFTAWSVWRLLAFVDKAQFPNYRNYSYILQRLGEHTANIKGVRDIAVDRAWKNGFDVTLERDPIDAKAKIFFR